MNRIVLKLGGTIMVLFLIVLLPLGYVANQILTNFYYSQVEDEIVELSEKYAQTIPSLQDENILNMYRNLAELTNKEIYILDESGDIVINSGVVINNLSEEDFSMMSKGQDLQKMFVDDQTDISYLGSGYPIIQSGQFAGGFFVLAPIDEIQEPIRKIRDLLILSAVGAILLALGFTFLLSKRMSRPLLEMEQATREIAKGNLNISVNIPSNDEIGSLGKTINNLAVETNRYRSNRREFLANISHELRTPLSYINGYSQVLKQGLYQTEEERIHYLTIIENESERITRLISDLFDLSKMEEGQFDFFMETINLSKVLENAISKIKMAATNKGLVIKKHVDENRHLIQADKDRLEQIFINLLANAVRYTEKGAVSVKVWQEDNKVHVIIEDTGIGIPKGELPYIFERFHRVEKSRSRELGGTGLGLAIVKQLVELQNGTISVNSEIGKGTSFQVSFPNAE
ncbi:sensor histidine kinase [Filobacillus milosensis]|nr:ATP-binding protein [Filobacillus milosensis]